MVGSKSNCVYVNGSNRPYYHRRCKGKISSTNIESLPDELVFDILLHLQSEDIHRGARLVCKKWYNTVRTRNFRCARLRNSTVGLLIHSSGDERPIFLTLEKGRVEMSKLSYKIPGRVWTSCNGLILDYEVMRDAYAAASMEYKVAQTFSSRLRYPFVRGCAILTVGVDKFWRHVDTENLSPIGREILRGIPLTTEGYFHWTHREGTRVLTLNVETEIITETLVPNGYGKKTKYYLSTGRSLTLLIACSGFSWEVLKMKSETGEWTKLTKVDLKARKCEFEQFVRECCGPVVQPSSLVIKPVGWLDEEVLVLNAFPTLVCVLYKVRAQEIEFVELDFDDDDLNFQVHRIRM
ncbi:hypothetical protein MIMGU_mgv1a009193mg [Erythranthe guttata]|uniref:F-box domain-containing protein n=1 Tax=Erythranthe guttata TaxID=4155 RepID=A0A022Q7V7_ERYGU|nr:hypothetical protein MIMGU_mgv1a009193mg [Erythranthe guttata]